jgi:hypothetical protein
MQKTIWLVVCALGLVALQGSAGAMQFRNLDYAGRKTFVLTGTGNRANGIVTPSGAGEYQNGTLWVTGPTVSGICVFSLDTTQSSYRVISTGAVFETLEWHKIIGGCEDFDDSTVIILSGSSKAPAIDTNAGGGGAAGSGEYSN